MVDDKTLVSVRIELEYHGTGEIEKLGDATGFFWKHLDDIFLVSNWHVFSGRDPNNGKTKDQKNYLYPTHLRVYFISNVSFYKLTILVNLYGLENMAFWRMHKVHGQKVDVGAICVSDIMNAIQKANPTQKTDPFILNELRSNNDIVSFMGSNVFIVGYPLGVKIEDDLPIWKRASVASEPDLNVAGVPSFLVDTATREGMSGSPVYAREFGSYQSSQGALVMIAGGPSDKFLGIYSGRYLGKVGEAHLGIIWKPEVLNEILLEGVPGDFTIT